MRLTGFCENANDYASDFFDQITDGTATLSLSGDGDGDYNGTLTAPAVYNTAAGTESATFNLAAINTTAGEPSSDVFEPGSELAVSAYAYEPGFFGASNGTETFGFNLGVEQVRPAGGTHCLPSRAPSSPARPGLVTGQPRRAGEAGPGPRG